MRAIIISIGLLSFPLMLVAQHVEQVGIQKDADQITVAKENPGFFSIPNDAGPMFGGYVEGASRIGDVSNHTAWFGGTGFSLVLGQRVHLGFRAYALLSGVRNADNQSSTGYRYLELAYGGLHIEPVIYHGGWWSLNVPILIGGGVAGTHTDRSVFQNWDYWDYEHEDWDVQLVVEPGVQVDLRLHKALHLAIGGYYRFTENTYLVGEGFPGLNGFSGQVALRVGWY